MPSESTTTTRHEDKVVAEPEDAQAFDAPTSAGQEASGPNADVPPQAGPAAELEAESQEQGPSADTAIREVRDVSISIIATLAVLYTIYLTRSLLFPITLAFLLNLICKPAILWMQRRHIPTVIGASLIPLAIAGVVALALSAVLEPAQRWMQQSPQDLREVANKIRSIRAPLERISAASAQVNEMTAGDSAGDAVKVEVAQPKFNEALLNTTGSTLAGATIVLTLLFFLLASGDRFLEKLVELMPTWSDKRRVVAVTRDVQGKVSRYLFTITLINLGLGATIGVGLWLIGAPNPILWGVMAALLNYIPFVGMMFGTAVVFFVGLVSFDSLSHALLAPAIYVAANGIEANLVTPSLVGRAISLNPVIVILSLFFWGWMWGIGGVLLAVPLLVVFKILCDHSEALAPVGVFLER